MPPSPAVGWLCVVHTIADIALRAAQIRSAQALPKSPSLNSELYSAPTRLHSVQADTRSSLDPIHHPCVTGKVVELEIPASEGSVVHGESSAPPQLNVVTGHQDNAFPPQLPDATECSVGIFCSTVQCTINVTTRVNILHYRSAYRDCAGVSYCRSPKH